MAEQDPQDKSTDTKGTRARTVTEVTEGQADDPQESGRIGVSPEAERTGRNDKGLSQANPNVLNGGPLPDARPGVDDSEAIQGLKG